MQKIALKDLNILSIGNTIGMVGALYEGEGRTIAVMFPGEELDERPIEVLAMSLEEWERFLLQTDVLEIEALAPDVDGRIVKAIVRKGQRQIDTQLAWKIFKRDGFRCRYCATADMPLTVDHLIVWEELGPTIEANLLSACKKCNRKRGNTPYEQWITDKESYYQKVCKNLDEATRQANLAIIATLASIPRVTKQRSR